jgi:hypothetical protein
MVYMAPGFMMTNPKANDLVWRCRLEVLLQILDAFLVIDFGVFQGICIGQFKCDFCIGVSP